MTSQVNTIRPTETPSIGIARIVGPIDLDHARMTTRRVRHLSITGDGLLCGIFSIGDGVKKQLTDLELEANVLRRAYRASRIAASLQANGTATI